MSAPLILASASATRVAMLRRAGLGVETVPARIDEPAVRAALEAEGAAPRDVADALAEAKARRVSQRHPEALVLGCDQILEHRGEILAKPATPDELRAQLVRLRGDRHRLHSAAVLCRDGVPVWRHVGEARLTMRAFSDSYLETYLGRNWPAVAESVGGYMVEEEGVRLFAQIEGSHFTIQGLPLMELLAHLALTGEIES
jgi:septum formation protein